MIEGLARYAAVGAVGTGAHYAVLLALVELFGRRPTGASTLGFAVGAAVNYVLNCRFTFQRSRPHREALPRFLAVAAAGMVVNSGIVALGVDVLGLPYMIPQVAATGVVVLATYGANRLWTFQRRNL